MQAKKFWLVALLVGCSGNVSGNKLSITQLPVELVSSDLTLGEQSGFADELGGIFADSSGKAVRLRVDGKRGPLESHPGNHEPTGAVRALFPAGPFSALVAADNGLYIAQSGWLIEPAWRDAMSAEGVQAAALAADGVAWIAHENGLFRMAAGELSELTVGGESLAACSALAAAPAPDGASAVWFVQDETLRYAKRTSRAAFQVLPADLDAESLSGGVLGMAGLSATSKSDGELWLLTDHSLLRRDQRGWVEYDAPARATQLLAAGRYAWLRAEAALYRYDAESGDWAKLKLPEPRTDLTILAADATGSAWLRSAAGETFQVRVGPVARVAGLFEGAHVYANDVQVRARFLADEAPDSVTFLLDGIKANDQTKEQALSIKSGTDNLEFALGGFDAGWREKSYSLSGLSNGIHTLSITAHYEDHEQTRALHFDFRAGNGEALSFAKDVQPIFDARCAKCHDDGPAHTLNSYEQWVAEKEKIVSAVTELRMPADGPLDPSQIQLLQRWASGGSKP